MADIDNLGTLKNKDGRIAYPRTLATDDKSRWAIDFYKSYITSNTELDFEEYYKQNYEK